MTTLREYALRLGMHPSVISQRIKRGWSFSDATTIPKLKTGHPIIHGHLSGPDNRATKTYRAWQAMKNRCLKPAVKEYRLYGARGITICERWMKFENFLADMGIAPQGLSIDRINNDGNYEPGNCRWATVRQQALNRRRTVFLTLNGETLCVRDWERKLGLSDGAVSYRLKAGMPLEKALSSERFR